MGGRVRTLGAAGLVLVLGAGCGLLDSASDVPDFEFDPGDVGDFSNLVIGADGQPVLGAGVGETCGGDADCRNGISCVSGACTPTGDSAEGTPCGVSAECGDGLACGITFTCEPSAGVEQGGQCTNPSDCGPGLRCDLIGFAGFCGPEGTEDLGGACTTSSDCMSPLMCSERGMCEIPAFGGAAFMPDADCVQPDDEAQFRAYFEVPRGEPLSEFYRLPFPNDARRNADGTVDMSGHHNPGLVYIGGELVDAYLTELGDSSLGFSTNPTVFFRFNQSIDFQSLVGGGDSPTIRFVNIDPDSENYGNSVSMFWGGTTGRGKFICYNYLAVHPAWASPLEHDTTYAVILTDGIRSADAELPLADDDFADIMSDNAPSDGALQRAWNAYAPLRAWLAEQPDLSATNVISAAVFTTMDPDADVPALREAVRAQPAPQLSDLTQCGAGVTSPCDDGDQRVCVNAGGFRELHARVTLPVWQQGERPYLFEGGSIDFSNGLPTSQGTEELCVALTLPEGPMPADGWPVVMYAHGTGGSFTSGLRDGTAGRLAGLTLADGRTSPTAMLTWDGVQHGNRRGTGEYSDLDSESLFYNFLNPNAGRGNVQQGFADGFAMTYLLENVNIAAADSPTGEAIRFDTGSMTFFGHSQGSQVGPSFVAHEPNVSAAVYSGAGGSITLSLLNKTEPVDIASAVSFVLTDGGTSGGEASQLDPLLALLQWWIDPVDPLNTARLQFRSLPEGAAPNNVFMSYGFTDSYTPEPNQEALAGAMGIPLGRPGPGTVNGVPTAEYPVSGNRTPNDLPATAILVASQPGDFDGHFVIFRNADLSQQMLEFIGSWGLDGLPTVPAP